MMCTAVTPFKMSALSSENLTQNKPNMHIKFPKTTATLMSDQ